MIKYLGLFAIAAIVPAAAAQAREKKDAFTFSAAYTVELWANVRGGLKRGFRYLDNLDLTLEVDGESAFAWPGATFFFYGLYNNHATLSDELVGDAQTVSNIDTGGAVRLYEAWLDQTLLADRLSLRFGLYDLNSEFDTTPARTLFINSSHGIGPDISQTGENGPSIFPVTSLALRAEYRPSETWQVRTAILDGVPGDPAHPSRTAIKLGSGDGALIVSEINRVTETSKYGIGYWRYTGRNDTISGDPAPREASGNHGLYLLAEQRVAGVTLFGRIGWADPDFNPISRYVGAGLVRNGPFAGRPDDELGLAVAWSEFGRPYRRASAAEGKKVGPREVNVELTYRAPINERLTVQPNLQYVVDPSGDPSLSNALVAGLRVEISF